MDIYLRYDLNNGITSPLFRCFLSNVTLNHLHNGVLLRLAHSFEYRTSNREVSVMFQRGGLIMYNWFLSIKVTQDK